MLLYLIGIIERMSFLFVKHRRLQPILIVSMYLITTLSLLIALYYGYSGIITMTIFSIIISLILAAICYRLREKVDNFTNHLFTLCKIYLHGIIYLLLIISFVMVAFISYSLMQSLGVNNTILDTFNSIISAVLFSLVLLFVCWHWLRNSIIGLYQFSLEQQKINK
jgi:hypothetical protein